MIRTADDRTIAGRLYDFAGRIEYELEPEEVQQREQEQIHYIVQEHVLTENKYSKQYE